MKQAVLLFFTIVCTGTALGTIKIVDNDVQGQSKPVVVDAELAPYVESYLELAAKHNIKFTHQVSVKIVEHIGEDEKKNSDLRTIGLCTYGRGWRTIDIDKDFFKNATSERRKILLYHELTHCYCDRGHDWGNGEKYISPETERLLASFDSRPFYIREPGYYLDQCPISIMHPIIVEQGCIVDHQDDYLQEMWKRCKPF